MEANPEERPSAHSRFSKRTTVIALTALGLLLAVFQINKMLSSSFRIEIFGVELLEVKHLEDKPLTTHTHRVAPIPPPPAPVPAPLPPLGPLPELEDEDDNFVVDVFVVVEEMPELIGGLRTLQREIRYPQIAKRAGIEGRVITQFIVDKKGNVESAQIVRGIGGGCDEEALRVVRQARFKPGKQSGKPVKVKMSLPITFKLQ